ncbi:MAG: hypothetical protein KDA57_13300 [Planctomycetales bacterium]|nr:hypothetical protein [Planctomycetales bacterium]
MILALLLTSPTFAQIHSGDVELGVADGMIVTNERVYDAEFGEIIPNEVDEPGFDSLPGTFPTGSSIGFTILDSLRKWNGTDFATIPTETVSIAFGTSLGPVVTPVTPSLVNGFHLNVSSDGSWHRHYDFVLNTPQSKGIYLLQLQLSSSDPTIDPTDPFFIVFNQNDSVFNHDAAIGFVESLLLVPEPSGLLLALIGGLCLRIRR